MNDELKLPEIGDTVLYLTEQYTIIETDHENLIYGIDNDNYQGFAFLHELTLLEKEDDNRNLREDQ